MGLQLLGCIFRELRRVNKSQSERLDIVGFYLYNTHFCCCSIDLETCCYFWHVVYTLTSGLIHILDMTGKFVAVLFLYPYTAFQ